MRFIRLQRSVESRFTLLLRDSLTALSAAWRTWKQQRTKRLSEEKPSKRRGGTNNIGKTMSDDDKVFAHASFSCFVEDGEVRLQMTVTSPPHLVGHFWFFKFPPEEALFVIDRMKDCLYELATEDEENE